MTYEEAIVLTFGISALVLFLIGNSFKKREDDLKSSLASNIVNNIFIRGIFFLFSLGFLGLAISSSQQFLVTNAISNELLNNSMTAGVRFITRVEYILFIIFFVLFIIMFVEKVLMGKRPFEGGEEYRRK